MNRRKFLTKSLYSSMAVASLSSASGFLQLAQAAARQNLGLRGGLTGYKALVCVYMDGGNDSANMIVPQGISEHAAYAEVRGNLALQREDLLPINPSNNGGRSWGLHPELVNMQNLFETNKAAVISNVGSLAYPITKEEYIQESVPVPLNLYSHLDQANQWQTSVSDQSSVSGWSGRIADLLHASTNNNNPLSMNISLAGNNAWQVGENISQYQMGNQGSLSLNDTQYADGVRRFNVVSQLLQANHSNLFQQGYSDVFNRSIQLDEVISAALQEAYDFTTVFPQQLGHNTLSEQLEMVAKMISVQSDLNMSRQVFFCKVGGFDNHDNHSTEHALGMRNIDGAISAFQSAIEEMGIENDVTLFTASDFGRTWRSNGQGSDHGWGASHFVVGGAVNGGDFYGDMPIIELGSDNAVSEHGRVIPTIAIDEYAATLAQWFGVLPGNQLLDILPNIGRFNSTDLGFLDMSIP
ncbi:DUF1501 domain-containing protein [Marinicella sp. W31]|uniref:DUF1501 domain-containing protein n=1 Tax=Marinicella sp. W31 TaxID=3023713 RepID=UPI003756ADDA